MFAEPLAAAATADAEEKCSNSSAEVEPSAKRTKLDGSQQAGKQRITRTLHIAVAGCSHGEMDHIYTAFASTERREGFKFDLLLCCGDFQAIRNYGDLHHLHVPQKYRKLMTFYKYYSGERTAPILTVFIGGNHESSGFLAELPNGGWVAPNIYYMGLASVVRFGGLRIAGWSGIFKGNDYNKGHFEHPPFHQHNSLISVYHVRSTEAFRLNQLKSRDDDDSADSKLNICLSHDWPSGITDFGDVEKLLKFKPYFREDIEKRQLGNPATMDLIHALKPYRWFAAHMHVRFPAEVPHADGKTTKFLSLDKPNPNPRRIFQEHFAIPQEFDAEEEDAYRLELEYDPTWLAILKNTDFLTEVNERISYMPGKVSGSEDRHDFRPTEQEIADVKNLFQGDLRIPLNFRHTAPIEQEPFNRARFKAPPSLYYRNPQSQELCEKLGIRDLNEMYCQATPMQFLGIPQYCQVPEQQQPSASAAAGGGTDAATATTGEAKDPAEIYIGGEEDEFGDEDFVIDAGPPPPSKNGQS